MIKMLQLKGDKLMTCQRGYVQYGSTKRDKFKTCRVPYVQTGGIRKVIESGKHAKEFKLV